MKSPEQQEEEDIYNTICDLQKRGFKTHDELSAALTVLGMEAFKDMGCIAFEAGFVEQLREEARKAVTDAFARQGGQTQ